MSGTDDFIRAIEGHTGRQGRRRGAETRLLCPGHDDHHPSLDVREGSDGQPLVQCRSHGCSYEEICRAIGREPTDFVPPLEIRDGILASYDYVDEHGTLLFEVVRKANKQYVVLCLVESELALLDFPVQVGNVWVMYPGALKKRLRKSGRSHQRRFSGSDGDSIGVSTAPTRVSPECRRRLPHHKGIEPSVQARHLRVGGSIPTAPIEAWLPQVVYRLRGGLGCE